MSKLCKTFQSPYSFQKPLCCFTLPTFFSVSFVVKSSKKYFLSGFLSADILLRHCLQLLSNKNKWFISLCLVLITLHSLSLRHSIMSSVGKKTSFGFRWNLFRYSSSSHLTQENFVSRFVCCLSFICSAFFFWSIETTTAKCTNPAKCTNQVTSSFFRALGNLVHYCINP